MNRAMEFHDSYLKDWGCDESGHGFMLFHAFVYLSEGEIVDWDNCESAYQNLRLDFEGMRIEGKVDFDFSEDTYLYEGTLWVNGVEHDNIVHLPANHEGELRMEICVAPAFEVTKIYATKMSSEFIGEFGQE